jgi:hypothetical protein
MLKNADFSSILQTPSDCATFLLSNFSMRMYTSVGRTAMDKLNIRPVYPLDDLCAEFGIGRSTAYAEIRAGRLRAFKIGIRTLVAGEDALAWREQYRAQGYRRAAYPARPLAA